MVAFNPLEVALAGVLGEERLLRIQGVKVGVAGAGGLGSNCAQMLVRSGFRRFCIVDFDHVDPGNLNRQFFFPRQVGWKKVEALKENLLLINPDIQIEALHQKIEKETLGNFFSDCHAVVEALDSADYKRLLVEHFMDSGKLLVAASGLAGWGSSDDIKVRRIKDNFFLVGDLVSEAGPRCPAMAPRVNTAAAKQSDVVLSYFLGQ